MSCTFFIIFLVQFCYNFKKLQYALCSEVLQNWKLSIWYFWWFGMFRELKLKAFQLKQKVLYSLSIFRNSVKANKRWKIVWNFGEMSEVITLEKLISFKFVTQKTKKLSKIKLHHDGFALIYLIPKKLHQTLITL